MAVTPFLKLQKPPFDTIPWDEAVNGNMDTIDAFIARYMAVPNYVGGWANSVQYISGQNVLDITNATIYQCLITHTSSAIPATFAGDRATYPTYWVATQNVVTGGAGNTVLTIAEATPLTAKAGDLWWDSLGGQLYVMYNDGNSLQWVIANNQAGNVGEAPNDGTVYGRRMSAWTPISQGNVGRNLIHNSMFNTAQRGAGPFTGFVYTLDRWATYNNLDTTSLTQAALSDADRAAIGDEAATYCLANTFTGNAGAAAVTQVWQPIEGVRRLAGKTVIVSFWAVAASGTPKLGVTYDQGFGTGGSPSATISGPGQSVTLSTTWTRYSVTIALPSASGKTLGTAGNDSTNLNFFYSSGATNATHAGNPGVQSGTVRLWGVQLEVTQPGQTLPTPLEKPDPELQLRQCQRFYIGMSFVFGQYAGSSGTYINLPFPQTMRAAPTVTLSGIVYTNGSAASVNSAQTSNALLVMTTTAGSNCILQANAAISADL